MTDIPDLRRGLESVVSCDPGGKAGLFFDGQRLTLRFTHFSSGRGSLLSLLAANTVRRAMEGMPLTGTVSSGKGITGLGRQWRFYGRISSIVPALWKANILTRSA